MELSDFWLLGAVLIGLTVAHGSAESRTSLSQNELMMGWRITDLEMRVTRAERRLGIMAEKSERVPQALLQRIESLEKKAVSEGEWRVLVERLSVVEKRSGENEWRILSERLIRLETAAESTRNILNAIGLAVIAQVVSTVWKIVIDHKKETKGE